MHENGSNKDGRRNDWKAHARAFFRNPLAVFGTIILIGFALLAIFAPAIAQFPRGYSADILVPPSAKHPFGTDDLGLSIFGQVVWGARVTMMVGVAASAVSLIVGVPLGLLAAYYRGRVDDFVSGAIDVFLSLPALPLMILIAAVLGPSILNVALIIGLLSWPQVARVVRAQGLATSEMLFTEAAHALGAANFHVLVRHFLPSAMPVIIVNLVLSMSRALLSEAGLSFLGLGDPLQWSWGRTLQHAQRSGAFVTAWWQTLFPSVAILLFVIATTFVGTALNDVLNPKLQKR